MVTFCSKSLSILGWYDFFHLKGDCVYSWKVNLANTNNSKRNDLEEDQPVGRRDREREREGERERELTFSSR